MLEKKKIDRKAFINISISLLRELSCLVYGGKELDEDAQRVLSARHQEAAEAVKRRLPIHQVNISRFIQRAVSSAIINSLTTSIQLITS